VPGILRSKIHIETLTNTMKINIRFLLLSAAIAALFSSLVYPDEVFIPATQIEKGKSSFALYYRAYTEKLDFSVSQKDVIKVGSLSYISGSQTDLESNGTAGGVYVKLMINPNNGLYYWLNAGLINYNLDAPALGVTNKYSSQDQGWMCGVGARKLLLPGTIVTPAVALDIGINYYRFAFDCLRSGDAAPVSADDQLQILETQADVVISKRIEKFEPYSGLKVYRKASTLADKLNYSNVSGIKNSAGLFLGCKFNFYQHEALVLEGSFGEDTSFSAGLNIEF
jgi:hypothetical protein